MENGIRINKFLSEAGLCSRREGDRLIQQGRVTIDGAVATAGMKVYAGQDIRVDKRPVKKEEEEILLAFYKPAGIVCTTAKEEHGAGGVNVVDYIKYPKRIYPVGRLDKNSEGLLLMTNQGAIADAILRSRNHHEKEYYVRVNQDITESFLKEMASGVHLVAMREGRVELDEVTRPCRIKKIDNRAFRIILTQGLNRQIRRMCEYFGYRVTYLRRDRIMNIRLDGMKKGQYRELTPKEREELLKLLGKRQEKE